MLSARGDRHDLVSASPAARDDDERAAFVHAAPTRAVGVGGGASVRDVDGITVVAKRIPRAAASRGTCRRQRRASSLGTLPLQLR